MTKLRRIMDTSQPTIEQWRDIPGHPGHQVSDRRRIRSVDRTITTTNGQARHYKGKVLCTPLNWDGYPRVDLHNKGERRKRLVHVLVAEAFIGPRPEGAQVCHGDGDPTNNHVDNLRYDTPSENTLDSVQHGTHPQAVKTHCPLGHVLSAENISPSSAKRGWRKCLACERARSYLKRHPELKPQLETLADSYFNAILNNRKNAA